MLSNFTKSLLGIGLALSLGQGNATEHTGTLKKIADTGTLTIGVRDNLVPFSYRDNDQNIIGFSVDICRALVDSIKADAEIQKVNVVYKPVTAQTRLALLSNGAIDIDCAAVTNNVERQKQVAFSSTFFLSEIVYAAKTENGVKSLLNLRGKPVAAVSGTNHMVAINELNQKQGLNLRPVAAKDQAEGFLMLSTDRAMALISDDVLLAYSIASVKNPSDFMISSEPLTPPEPYGLVMRRDDPEFKTSVDRALKAYLPSPAAQANYDKWFVQPIPPRGLRMNFPMSPKLRKAYANPTDSIDPSAY